MAVTYQDYLETVKSPVAERILKINLLDNNYNIIKEITPKLIDGNISLTNGTGSRRSANITFINNDGSFTPDPSNDIWINTRFQLFTGMIVNNQPIYFSQGIFITGEPEIISQNGSDLTMSLQLYDQWTLLDNTLKGGIENSYIVPVGSLIEDVIKQILLDAGETRPPIVEPLLNATTPYTLVCEAGDSYASMLIKISEMLSMTCFFDENGYFRLEKSTSDINNIFNEGSVWDFNTDEIIYLGGRRKLEFSKVRNHCVVIGANLNGTTFRATASDTNPLSPTRISLIGKRPLIIIDDLIYSTDLAQQRCNYELMKAVQVLESIDVECVPIDCIKPDQVVTLHDVGLSVENQRYIVTSINIPLLNTGSMQLGLWKARSFQ